MKTKVICFANNKGGSGKSTTCSNVAYGLTMLGKKVLMLDGDMQCNLSLAYFSEDQVLEIAKSDRNLYRGILEQKNLRDCIYHTAYENLDLIPSSSLMSGIEFDLFTKWQREFILRNCLEEVKNSGEYDYILLDAPPTLGCFVMNLLIASDYLVIPVEASPWGLFGLANMFDFLKEVQKISPALKLMGIAVTKVDTRKNYVKQTMEYLNAQEEVHVFNSFIRMDSMIEWSQDNSMPVIAYKKSSRSAQEYMELAKEVDQLGSR
ncbi:MAG: ParA family protein [Lachnospiraceae bacterium]|nr:ParA family protein [Lachnospiraceae bacterium]